MATAAAPTFDGTRRFGGGDNEAGDMVVRLPVLRHCFFDAARFEPAAAGCLGEDAVFAGDDGVGVVDRHAEGIVVVVVVLTTSRDVTERGVDLPVRRLAISSAAAPAVDWRPRLADVVLPRAGSTAAGPFGHLDSTAACDAVAMFGVDR